VRAETGRVEGLYKAESTDENLRKIKALESQIGRHERIEEDRKAGEKAVSDASVKAKASKGKGKAGYTLIELVWCLAVMAVTGFIISMAATAKTTVDIQNRAVKAGAGEYVLVTDKNGGVDTKFVWKIAGYPLFSSLVTLPEPMVFTNAGHVFSVKMEQID